jgi:murein DD-endopeptidase MepM/ murein hydrolase activator NlpD
VAPRPQPVASRGVFPVRGAFNFGGSDARFGAPRRGHVHQGQDVLAAEGTPLVAPVSGSARYTPYQAGGAGNYVVIRGRDGRDYVLMHLRHPAVVRVGDTVRAGQQIGLVGHTGDAFGPHLHFEIWVGGWQSGGHPIDPLPFLRSLS